jgi:hypothetical protein
MKECELLILFVFTTVTVSAELDNSVTQWIFEPKKMIRLIYFCIQKIRNNA